MTSELQLQTQWLKNTLVPHLFIYFCLKNVCGMYMYACSIVCGGAFMCVHACVSRHEHSNLMPGVFLCHSPLYSLKQTVLHLGLLSLPPEHCNYQQAAFPLRHLLGFWGSKVLSSCLEGKEVIHFTSSASRLSIKAVHLSHGIFFRYLPYPALD